MARLETCDKDEVHNRASDVSEGLLGHEAPQWGDAIRGTLCLFSIVPGTESVLAG